MSYDILKFIENIRLIVSACDIAHKPNQTLKDRMDVLCDNHYSKDSSVEDVQVYDAMMFYIIAEERLKVKADLYYDSPEKVFTLTFKKEDDCKRFAKFFNDIGFTLKSEPTNVHFDRATLDALADVNQEADLEMVLEGLPTFWGFEFYARYGNE